jgi:hypothetical protein
MLVLVLFDVLDSTRRLYDANRNLSDARYNYILSVLQLRQAVYVERARYTRYQCRFEIRELIARIEDIKNDA